MPRNPATGPQAPGPAAHAGAKRRPRRKTMTPRRPPDEAQRLAALAEFGAMDTPPEHDFDVLVKRLAQVCDVPIALICLVDADRAWFKARIGLEMHETPRDVSFAAHVILGDDIFEVPDAEADQRFAGNPYITKAAGVRFYAGVPLRTPDGYKIGALGIGDRAPRRLSRAQREALRRIAGEVMVQFERRRHLRASAVEQALETVDRGARTGEADDLPIAGSRFGRYTVLDEIGRGAMATVYTAYDDQLDRRIAIKLIRDPGARVQREAQAAARISHPNVVQIYELGAYAGHDFIAMELVDGITLTTWQRIRSRSVYEIIAMYAQAGRGLAAAHRVGLVHRDFKPDNVLIDSHGRARVGDFGLAYSRDRTAAPDPTLISTWGDGEPNNAAAIVGTPAYMAPEQLQSPDVDERADQFSLCAALYEAVYGVRPFRGTTLAELQASAHAGVLQEPLPGVSAPPGLRALLLRGLAIDPAQRWPTLEPLLDRLDQIDARSDPGAAGHERRRLLVVLAGIVTVAVAMQQTRGAGDVADLSLAAMLSLSAAVLLVGALAVYIYRESLLRNHYHRRMIAVILAAVLGCIGVTAIAGAAGLPIEWILLVEMLAMGQMFLLAAPLVAPALALNCVILWLAAAAVAAGAPVLPVSAVTWMLCLMVLATVWSYAPTAASSGPLR